MLAINSSDPGSSFLSLTESGSIRPRLQVWRDRINRAGIDQMALDEALFLESVHPVLRFYAWSEAEITIGFFTPMAQVAHRIQPLTRRWTGGGVVEHGEDVTFCLAVPRSFLKEKTSAGERYHQIHEALAAALRNAGLTNAQAVTVPQLQEDPSTAAVSPGFCFSEPVAWDVVDSVSGAKLAGGAQRRSRSGLLHQGSIRLPESYRSLDHEWLGDFAARLTGDADQIENISDGGNAVLEAAKRLQRERYDSPEWRHRF